MTPPQPDFSIIIPTYGRAERLAVTLAALERLESAPGSFEVVVVDDGNVPQIQVSDSPFPVRVIRQQRGGPSCARNRGAREACGAVLVFLDDDCSPKPGWLRAISTPAKPGVAVGGLIRNGLPDNAFAEASHLILGEFTRAHRSASDNSLQFLPAANLAVDSASFWHVGGFDERFQAPAGEDRDFCARWLRQGYSLVLEPEAVVVHSHSMGLAGFIRQHFAYGGGARRFYESHPLARRTPGSFYSGLLSAPFGREVSVPASRVVVLLGISQIVSSLGYLAGSRRAR
ncbi:MAG: glycosyltransferase [Gemmatimonadaceae bacterium]